MTLVSTLSTTVVICAYTEKRWDDLLAAIASTDTQTLRPDRILVVIDNNAVLQERLTAELERLGTRADVVANTATRGLSGARNTAIALATSDLIAFLDDDACPEPDWLEHLVAPFDRPEVQVTGGRAVPRWPDERPGWFPREFDWVVGSTYLGMPETEADVRNVHGASMAFRADAFANVGGFQEHLGRVGTLPVGCEETELCIRIAQQMPSARITYTPASRVLHRVSDDRVRLAYFVKRCYSEGISKAEIGRLVGADAGTSDERSYVSRTLPAGVARGVGDALRGRPGGPGRAGAIVLGLLATVVGYVRTVVTGAVRTAADHEPTEPTEPSEPAGAVTQPTARTERGVWCPRLDLRTGELTALVEPRPSHESVRALVRDGRHTLGYLVVDRSPGEVDATELTALAREQFADQFADQFASSRDTTETAGERPLVSVVVCTRDRAAKLPACLDALATLSYPELEIVVVDNAPTDSSTRDLVTARSARDPRFRYALEARPGLSNARNRGLVEARGEYVAYTDDDVTVEASWIDAIVAAFIADPAVACVTGLVCTAGLTTAAELYFDSRISGWSSNLTARTFDLDANRPDTPHFPYAAGAFGAGANFAVHREAVLELGGFDPALGAGSLTRGGEDLDMFVRILLSRRALRYEPDALVWHHHRADDAELLRQLYGYGTGLSAYVTKLLLSRRTRVDVLRKVVAGFARMRDNYGATAERADGRPSPKGATAAEVRGLLRGPLLYLRARRETAGQEFTGSL